MHAAAGWEFDVEIHPPDWLFPAGRSWIAGWTWSPQHGPATDVRAWIDGRPFLGLHGLPRPEIEGRLLQRPGPPYLGFSLLLEPHAGARSLRLDVREPGGHWRQIFCTAVTVAPGASPLPARPTIATLAAERIPELLRLHSARPEVPWSELADEVVSGVLAVPLDSLPNPPFFGALEEPRSEGWIRYGRLAITGWLGHRGRRVRRLTAMVDAREEHVIAHGLNRRDIAARFPGLVDGENLAFIGHADLAPAGGRSGLLKLFAELDNGEKHLAFAQRFSPRVILGNDTPLPPLSRRTFARAVWALRGAGRRHGLEMGPFTVGRAALHRAWESYSAEAPAPPVSGLAVRPLAPAAAAKPLGVLIVTHNLNPEGAPWFILEYARHLAAQPGWRVRVISPVDGPLREKFTAAGLTVELVDLRVALAARSVPEFETALSVLSAGLDWSGIDLVVANTMVAFWGVHLARLAHRPALLYIHESAPVRRFFAPLLDPALVPAVESAFAVARRVVFIAAASRAVYGRLEQRNNFLGLPSWIDVAGIDRFVAASDPPALRARHGLPRDAVIFANIGSVCERKGQHIFVRAVAHLRDDLLREGEPVPPLHFLMVGARPGPYLEELRHDLRLLGLTNVGIVDEVPGTHEYYRLADIFVCSSFEEAFPRVLLEAAAFSLPIVSTNVHGIAEMLGPDDAWLVAPGDAAALAGAMAQALRAHRAGDHTRARRARAAVAARYAAEQSLPLHRAAANEAAS